MKKTSLTIALLIFISLVYAQNYSETKLAYTKILNETNLSSFFEVSDIIDFKGFHLLQLKFTYTDTDSASVAWQTIKERFEQDGKYSISEYLFFRYMHTIQQAPTDLAIKIQETYDPEVQSCTDLLIYFDKKTKKVKTIENFCKAISKSFPISFDKIKVGNTEVSLENASQNRHEVYESIIKFTQDFYKTGGFEKDKLTPKAKFTCNYKEGEEKLVMKVFRLKNEVLNDQEQNYLCNALQWWYEDDNYCDYRAWEYLQFTIEYNTVSNIGAKMICTTDGRFSSGFYNPVVWNNANKMEPEFTTYLDTYTENFLNKLYKYLKK